MTSISAAVKNEEVNLTTTAFLCRGLQLLSVWAFLSKGFNVESTLKRNWGLVYV